MRFSHRNAAGLASAWSASAPSRYVVAEWPGDWRHAEVRSRRVFAFRLDHDARDRHRHDDPACRPPNCLLPVILLSSASKSNFGSSKHLIKNKPVAVALLILVNPNLNCGDPVPAPLDGVIAITAHFVGMTWGDFFAGIFEMVLDIGLAWAIGKLCGKLDRISQRIYEKFLVGPLGSMLGRMGFGPISSWLLRHDFQEMMFKGFGAKLTKILGSDAIGSPLGYSFPINGFGIADSLFGENGAAQGSYDAVHDYVDSPSVDTHDVPPDGAEGRSGVDEGDGGTGGTSGDGGVPSDAGSDTAADSATSTSGRSERSGSQRIDGRHAQPDFRRLGRRFIGGHRGAARLPPIPRRPRLRPTPRQARRRPIPNQIRPRPIRAPTPRPMRRNPAAIWSIAIPTIRAIRALVVSQMGRSSCRG